MNKLRQKSTFGKMRSQLVVSDYAQNTLRERVRPIGCMHMKWGTKRGSLKIFPAACGGGGGSEGYCA